MRKDYWNTSLKLLPFVGKESYYEELSRLQRVEMEKKEKEIAKNEMVLAATKKAEEEAKKR